MIDDGLGDEVRITVIAAGFDRFEGERRPSRGLTSLGLDDDDDLGDGIDFAVARRRRRAATATTSSTSPSSCADRRRDRSRPPAPASVWSPTGTAGSRPRRTTTRNLGDHVGDDPAAVAENRAPRSRAAPSACADPAAWVWLRQVHGADGRRRVDGAVAATPPEADAAVTDDARACRSWSSPPTARRSRSSRRRRGRGRARRLAGPRAGRDRGGGRRRCARSAPARSARSSGRASTRRATSSAPTTSTGSSTGFGPTVAGRTADGAPALDIPAGGAHRAGRVPGSTDVDDVDVCTVGVGRPLLLPPRRRHRPPGASWWCVTA